MNNIALKVPKLKAVKNHTAIITNVQNKAKMLSLTISFSSFFSNPCTLLQ
jgi:hypothetical protein